MDDKLVTALRLVVADIRSIFPWAEFLVRKWSFGTSFGFIVRTHFGRDARSLSRGDRSVQLKRNTKPALSPKCSQDTLH
jgi:hypothetical protein